MAGLAGVALALGQAEEAARLLGAIEAARDAVGMRRMDNWLHAERITADTRAALEPAAFERAWATGRPLPLEEAVAEALMLPARSARAQKVDCSSRPIPTSCPTGQDLSFFNPPLSRPHPVP